MTAGKEEKLVLHNSESLPYFLFPFQLNSLYDRLVEISLTTTEPQDQLELKSKVQKFCNSDTAVLRQLENMKQRKSNIVNLSQQTH